MALDKLIGQLKEESKKSELQIQKLGAEKKYCIKKLKEMTAAYDDLKKKYDESLVQLSENSEECSEQEKFLMEIEFSVEKLRDENETLIAKNKKLKKGYDNCSHENEELKEEISDWKSETKELRQEIKTLEGYSRFIDEPDPIFSYKLHLLIDQIVSELRSESKKLKTRIGELEAQNLRLICENE